MVFRISEIEEKREKVPEKFRANPANALTDTFDDKRADEPTEQERRNAALRTLSEADSVEREADRAGVLAGRAREGMYNNAAAEQAQKRAEKARKERAETAMYLAMLQDQINDLNDQIKWHTDEIERLESEVDELDDLAGKIKNGTLDPNDSDDAAIMAKYGIQPDDLDDGGAAALKKIQAGKDTRQTQIDQHKNQRTSDIKKRNKLEQEAAEAKAKVERVEKLETKGERVAEHQKTFGELDNQTENATISEIKSVQTKAEIREGLGYAEPDRGSLNAFDTKIASAADGSVAEMQTTLDESSFFADLSNSSSNERTPSVAETLTPNLGLGPDPITPQYNTASRGENAEPVQQIALEKAHVPSLPGSTMNS